MNPDKYPGRSDFFTNRTWPQFLELVAASRDPNYLGLLLPLPLRCAPCTFQYDAILNMDTFEQDVRHLMEAAGATWVQVARIIVLHILYKKYFLPPLNIFQVPHFNSHGNTRLLGEDRPRLEGMFGEVGAASLARLLDKYEADFLMCGYNTTLAILRDILAGKTGGA